MEERKGSWLGFAPDKLVYNLGRSINQETGKINRGGRLTRRKRHKETGMGRKKKKILVGSHRAKYHYLTGWLLPETATAFFCT